MSGIRGGVFPANPGPPDRNKPANCRFCDFDSLCPARRADLWERKKADPLLSGYLALSLIVVTTRCPTSLISIEPGG